MDAHQILERVRRTATEEAKTSEETVTITTVDDATAPPLPEPAARPEQPRYSAAHYRRVAAGIYRSASGRFMERPVINGRRTWRVLAALTLAEAKLERAARSSDSRRASLGLALDPYAKTRDPSVGSLLDHYDKLGCPERRGTPRRSRALSDERARLALLRQFWERRLSSEVCFATASDYGRKRLTVAKGKTGRAVDMELTTLSNAITCARQFGLVTTNPIDGSNRPRFHNRANARHARDVMPESAEELHEILDRLFSREQSEAIGWQATFEALTGCRTGEVLRFRVDGRNSRTPGFVDEDHLHLARLKGGVNPWVVLTPELRSAIVAHRAWLANRFPESPWWFPCRLDQGVLPTNRISLTNALQRVAKALSLPGRTSHGLRAYFVTVRRSQGIPDGQIAAEIGDRTGASIIESTYGGVPPNWRGKGHLTWLPKGRNPAWEF